MAAIPRPREQPCDVVELEKQARALSDQVEASDDNLIAEKAVAVWQQVLALRSRANQPLVWAQTNNNFGWALTVLALRRNRSDLFDQAIAAHRAALEVATRDRSPREWSRSLALLGLALTNRASLEQRSKGLPEAVVALRLALEEVSREQQPAAWATVQINLGDALTGLANLGASREELTSAMAALRNARQPSPIDAALRAFDGDIFRAGPLLIQAVAGYRAALSMLTREAAPLDWARAQKNLGTALTVLGSLLAQRDSGSAPPVLQEALDAFNRALLVTTRETHPLKWAITQNQLGWVLRLLGLMEPDTERLSEAAAAFDNAISGFEQVGAEAFAQIARESRASLQLQIERRRHLL